MLQRAGLIEYHRGHITVLDRSRLEARTCECYEVVRQEYDRLLPRPFSAGQRQASVELPDQIIG